MKQLLQKICLSENRARAEALQEEIHARNISYECMDNMAIVVPAKTPEVIVLCAHFDVVPGSFGYNDNGMSLVAVLSMLKCVPDSVEIVFTNGEECGFLGSQYYLKHSRKQILGCINLDVCGFGNMVYCDPMNSGIEPAGCKIGHMPLNDGCVFAEHGIPSITLSTGPAEVSFQEGIRRIGETIHNGPLDNSMEVLNFNLPLLTGHVVSSAIQEFSSPVYSCIRTQNIKGGKPC